MQKRFHIQITQQAINDGVRRDSSHCMIAEAVRAQIPNAIRVSVDLATVRWSDPTARRRYVAFTPPLAQMALVDFDQGRTIEPFEMRLSVVQTIKMGGGSDTKGSRAGETEPRTIVSTERDKSHRSEPVIEGGRLPPTAALSNRRGRRRRFGIRSLDR